MTKLTEQQQEIAIRTMADAVLESAISKEPATPEQLKQLAESIGEALAAGINKLNQGS